LGYLSFLYGFSYRALSERMAWTGIGLMLITILIFGSTVGGIMVYPQFTRSAHAEHD
jgi:hypothetical protein